MNDENKTKEQLMNELVELRQRIAELEALENKRKNSEEMCKKYEFIANTAKELMTLINRDYIYEAANEPYCKTHKKTQEEIIGKTVTDIWGEEVFNTIIKGYLDKCFAGDEVHYQEWFKFSDSEPCYFDVSYYPYCNERGAVTNVVVITRDITERKRAEEELQKSRYHLEEVLANLDKRNRELESFVYTVSHDLKAPLVSLEGFASMLLDNYRESLDEIGQLYLDRIQANVNGMASFIQKLLEFSRIGRIVHLDESLDVTEIIQEAIETLQIQLLERGTEWIIQADMPMITCDRVRIKQIFENLIDNANKYMGEENDKPRIEIGFHDKRDFFEFFVKDNGMGIQKEYHEKVFEIFTRLGDVEVEGTGAGLAIVKKIVESHGGRIWISSELGEGTTVYFTLPKTCT